MNPEIRQEQLLNLFNTYSNYRVIYTDGSKSNEGSGFALYEKLQPNTDITITLKVIHVNASP